MHRSRHAEEGQGARLGGTKNVPRTMSRPKDSRFPYMPGIDAMRALAVLAVFGYHAGLDWVPRVFHNPVVGAEEFSRPGPDRAPPLRPAPPPPPPPRGRRADRGGDDRLGD